MKVWVAVCLVKQKVGGLSGMWKLLEAADE